MFGVLETELEVGLGPVEMIPPGEGRVFCVDGRSIAVFRQRDGALFAARNECPHKGGPLAEGVLGGGVLICPMHSWKFSLKDGACLNDPGHCLETYPIRDDGGQMFLQLRFTDR